MLYSTTYFSAASERKPESKARQSTTVHIHDDKLCLRATCHVTSPPNPQPPTTTPHNTHTRTTHQSHWFRVWLKANTQTSPPAAALGETVNYWMYVQTMSHQIHAHQTDSPTGCAFSCGVFENSRARARRLVARLLLHIVRREGEFLMSAAVISSVYVKTRLFINPLFPPYLNFQWRIWAALTAWHLTALVSWPRRVHVSLVKNRAGDCLAKLDFHPSV